MAFSDEPQVVRSTPRRRWLWWALPAMVAVLATLLLAAVSPSLHQWRRDHARRGALGGPVYEARFEARRFALELARVEHRLAVHWTPAPAEPEGLEVRIDFRGESGPTLLSWDPSRGWHGPGGPTLHPEGDYIVRVEIGRGGAPLWTGEVWAYAPGGGHRH